MARAALLSILAVAVLTAGCGGGDAGTSTPTVATPAPQRPAKLPHGWHRRFDITEGLSYGVPPGWKASSRKSAALVRSPDRLVAVSISADRTPQALGIPIDDFATRTLAALPGYHAAIHPGPARRFGGTPLDAVSSRATSTSASGTRQHLTVVVLRRDDYVNYTSVVVADAGAAAHGEEATALKILRTVRDYPLGTRPGPSNGA